MLSVWYSLAALVAAAALFSCTSIPAPKSETDSLLVVPVEPVGKDGENAFGYYRIYLRNVSKMKKAIYTDVYAGSSTKTIGDLQSR